MRGRTNITPRKDPLINGDVQNFVVASGNTIAKGDFVSYQLQTDSKSCVAVNPFTYATVERFDGNLFVVKSNYRVINLVEADNDFVIRDTISTTDVAYFVVGGDGKVYVGEGTNLNVYSVVDKQFVLEYTVVSNKAICGVMWLKSTQKCVVLTKTYVSNVTTFYIQLVTVSGGSATIGAEISVYASTLTTYTNPSCYCGCLEDDTFVIYFDCKSSSSAANTYYASLLCVYENGVVTSTKSSLSTSALRKVQFYDNVAFVMALSGSTNYNFTVVGLSEGQLISLGTYSTTYSYAYFYACDGYFVLNRATSVFVVLRWNKDNKVLSNSAEQTITYGSTTPYWAFKKYGSDEVVMLSGNASGGLAKMYVMNPTTLVLTDGYFSNVVEEYNGGYTVGFAKTGGSGGSTIEVYTPYSS